MKKQIDTVISNKINDLFSYRMVDKQIDFSHIDCNRDYLYESLKKLQYNIFQLDKYIENNWDVSKKSLQFLWENIYSSLSDLGVPKHFHDEFCKEIYSYQKIELNLRVGILPTKIPIHKFYYYKTCDVRLIRKIIFFKSKLKINPFQRWNAFDLITEVGDDLFDLIEDENTYNCNRLLISIILNGVNQTVKEYSSFILSQLNQNKKLGHLKDKSINIDFSIEKKSNEILDLLNILKYPSTRNYKSKIFIKNKRQELNIFQSSLPVYAI